MMNLPWKDLDDMVRQIGKDETFKWAVAFWKNKMYRKDRNMKDQALLKAAKKDPRYRDLVSNSVASTQDVKKKSA